LSVARSLALQHCVDKYYHFYQDKVSAYVKKRTQYFEQAEQAFNSGNKALAKELSLKGKAITAKIEKAQADGAQALFKAKYAMRCIDRYLLIHAILALTSVVATPIPML
jgi:biotin operon repressor